MSATLVSDVASSSLSPLPGGRPRALPKRRAIAYWGVLGSVTIDALLVAVAGLIAYRLRFPATTMAGLRDLLLEHSTGSHNGYLGFLSLYVALLVLVALSQNLYNLSISHSRVYLALLVLRSVGVATLLVTALIFLAGNQTIPRLAVGYTAVLSLVMLTTWRLVRHRHVRKQISDGIGVKHALIIGAGRVGRLFAAHIEQNPSWGYKVLGFLDCNACNHPRVLGKIEDLRQVVRREFIDEIFITIPSERELVKEIVLAAYELGIRANVIPELYDGMAWQKPIEFLGEFPLRVMYREPIPEPELFVKRLVDIAGSILGLIVLSPLFAIIAVAIKIDSSGPVFYRATRVGRKARLFHCLKFRTMIADADHFKDKLRHLNERQGPFFKITSDPRVTRVGKVLRKYSLDELPQLWNVLCGEMSLVGPRPHPLDDYQQYKLEHLRRLDITPGITCLWQVIARDDPSFDRALALDIQYIENWNFLLDLRILLKTIPSLIRGTGQ